MNSYRFILILLFFIPLFSSAQDTIYFNQDWYVVEKSNAKQYTTVSALKGNPNQFMVKDFTIEGVLLADYQYKGLLASIDWSRIYENDFQAFAIEDGSSCEYFASGSKKKELIYENGMQKGLIKVWNENGEKIRSFYAENKIANGSYNEYFKNGNTSFTVQFKNDTLQGNAIYYHENGKISKLGKFNKGMKTGKWQYISEEGRPIAEEIYKPTFFIDGPDVNVSFPEGKWYLADKYKEGARLNFLFSRVSFTDFQEGENLPSCLITLERIGNELDLLAYSADRRRHLSIDLKQVLTKEKNVFSLPNTMGYVGDSSDEKNKERVVYLIHSIQNGIGMEMILDCKKENYEDLKGEFSYILKSLKN